MNKAMTTAKEVTELELLASVDATHATRGVLGNDAEGITLLPLCFKPLCIPTLPPVTGSNA
ncbi:hypothetical protein PPN31114_04201 [Pandoraea pneumonica]|jgi:hypothetical protein|uniref:Uncharacterized protein n=1 Tax=Pandoraea pneumonica TaxID=2508299 RepID=A0A5E4XZY6_9BURK|nr:hypothetical protein [Pandoraea pneumonica]VVE41954.1 hypothetical protein PPN31114_04201 [Pandoraea pneumonica]